MGDGAGGEEKDNQKRRKKHTGKVEGATAGTVGNEGRVVDGR